jgi:very-short-patch-repair endonuclease
LIGKTNPNAKRLRRDSTDAERALWLSLRNRQLDGLKFRRQATIGPYIADFQCIERRLVVEVDGGHHSAERDGKRTDFLEALGWTEIRFWNNDVLENREGVLEAIAMAAERTTHSPNLLPQAEEG